MGQWILNVTFNIFSVYVSMELELQTYSNLTWRDQTLHKSDHRALKELSPSAQGEGVWTVAGVCRCK